MKLGLRSKIIIVLLILLIAWFIWRIVIHVLIPLAIVAIIIGWIWNLLDNKKKGS